MINLSLLNNFYPVILYRRVRNRKRRIIVYGVTRYGPRSVASASGQNSERSEKRKKVKLLRS